VTSAATRFLGVLGWPVGHSRSPAIHTAALASTGIDAVYVAFPVPPEQLPAAVGGLRALGALGANVTLPHKERVMELLDELEPAARAIGAVNTIVRDGDRLIGTNTDGAGLARSLGEAGVRLDGARVLVVGAGGAGRASVFGLAQAGAAEIAVAARRLEQAERLVAELAASTRVPLRAVDLRDEALREVAGRTDLLVQATSATLGDSAYGASFAAVLPLSSLPESAVVVDLVYVPRETAVMKAAAARGLRTVDGLGMLVWQAALAFQRWTGIAPPIDVLRRAAEG
jgi:shikimate dehydrogenase